MNVSPIHQYACTLFDWKEARNEGGETLLNTSERSNRNNLIIKKSASLSVLAVNFLLIPVLL
jgi:hypothetical protein